jgi:hypothetical protein
MEPEVRYFILCDDVRPNSNNYLRVDAFGLVTNFHPLKTPAYPCVRPMLCVLLILSGGSGEVAEVYVRIKQEANERLVYRTPPRQLRLARAQHEIYGGTFRLCNCSFPEPGLYWVECLLSGTVLARKSLWLL